MYPTHLMPDSLKIYSSEKALEKIDEIKSLLSSSNAIVVIYVYTDKQKRDTVIEMMKMMSGGVKL